MKSDDERDVALILRIQKGDPSALDTLLRIYWVRLNCYARRIVGSPDAAQDVIQEVFLRLWRYRETLMIPSGVAPYLYRMTRNQAMTTINVEQTVAERDARWFSSLEISKTIERNSGERTIESDDVLRTLLHALADVPPRCREIFLLSWEHDLSYADIAAMLGITIPTVRNQMSRAVIHLGEVLRPETVAGDER